MPNLDGMDRTELWTFFEDHKQGTHTISARLFPNRPRGYTVAARNLAHYACNKAVAMDCRARGDILGAGIYEGICERIYNDLPSFARW